MKIAFLSESEADEAAVRILVGGVVSAVEKVGPMKPRSRGWPGVKRVLHSVIRELHYHTDADGLVIVIDSDSSPVHTDQHDSQPLSKCRLCQLEDEKKRCLAGLRKVSGKQPLQVAIGLAVPSIEAWLLAAHDPHPSEAEWLDALKRGVSSRTRINEMKQKLFGTDRPSLKQEADTMVQAAKNLVTRIEDLEARFPNGFGYLARVLRTW